MKILLRKNVEKLGSSGDVVEVANGYARNYLLPKKFATTVTPGNIEQINIERKKLEGKRKGEIDELQTLSGEISNVSCTITVKTNKEGKLFGSVTAHHIAKAISEKGFNIDENMIILESPIKKCDLYNVTVVLHPEVEAKCRIWVVSESEKDLDTDNEATEPPS